MPAWIATALAGPLTLFGAARWAHRFAILAVVLFIAGLLALVATTDASTAVHESCWLPLLATSAALTRNPQRVSAGRHALGTTGMAVTGVIGIGAAAAYVAAGPGWWSLLPNALRPVFYTGRRVLGGVLLAACLVGLSSRTVRAAIPVTAALGMAYVGGTLPWVFWSDPFELIGVATGEYSLMGSWVVQLVAAPLVVFVAARTLTALIDRAGRSSGLAPLTG